MTCGAFEWRDCRWMDGKELSNDFLIYVNVESTIFNDDNFTLQHALKH